ncbi:MAG: MoaD/ThiS family protein [Dehalococcoidia bacterium]
MAVVHIPAHWRDRTGGRATVEVQGRNLREVINSLDAACPGMKALITDESGDVRGEIAIAINSEITESGMLEPVPEGAEVFLVPAIGGGAQLESARPG